MKNIGTMNNHYFHRGRSVSAVLLSAVVMVGVAGCSVADKGAQPKDPHSTCFMSQTEGYLESTIAHDLDAHLQQAAQKKSLTLKNVDNLAKATDGQCATVITYGSGLAKQAIAEAKKNPAINFAIDSAVKIQDLGVSPEPSADTSLPKNVKPYTINIEQGGIVAGYIAAGITQTGIVGSVIQDKSGEEAATGFAQGVSRYNQLHGTGIEVRGADSSQAAPSKDINAALTQLIDDNADIIIAVVGQEQPSIPGLAGKAEAFTKALGEHKSGIVWVGEDGHENYESYAGQSLTSLLIDTDPVAQALIKAIGEDSFNTELFEGDLRNDTIALADFHDYSAWISDELRKEIESLRSELTDGQAKPLPSPTPSPTETSQEDEKSDDSSSEEQHSDNENKDEDASKTPSN